ncbi:g214 [Coccomyxa elongata]
MDFLLNLPTRDSSNFSSCGPASTSLKEEQPRLKTYQAAHDRTDAPASQVITTESTSILVREFERSARKLAGAGRWKRAAGQGVQQPRASKHPRRSCIFEGNYRDMQDGLVAIRAS